MKELTIVIPCLYEKPLLESRLKLIVSRLHAPGSAQIVLVDAFFDAESRDASESLGVIYTTTKYARRSVQLNHGAGFAVVDSTLFFLHIDSIPPQGFDKLIRQSLNQGAESGCFTLGFDGGGWFLKAFAWFSRLSWPIARGGDQGLFVHPEAFKAVGGFRSDFPVMEDIEICRSLLRRKTFVVRREKIVTSARKYNRVGVLKLQAVFTLMHFYYWLGRPIDRVHAVYRKYVA